MEHLTTINPTTPVGNPSNMNHPFKSLMSQTHTTTTMMTTNNDSILPRATEHSPSSRQTGSSSSPNTSTDKSFATPDNMHRTSGNITTNCGAQQTRLDNCSAPVAPSVTPSSVVSNRSPPLKEDDMVSGGNQPTFRDKRENNVVQSKSHNHTQQGVVQQVLSHHHVGPSQGSLDSRILSSTFQNTTTTASETSTTKSSPLNQKLSQERQIERNEQEEDDPSRPKLQYQPPQAGGKLMSHKGPMRSTTPVPSVVGNKSKNVRTPVRTPKSNHQSSWNAFHTHASSSDMPNFGSPSIFLSPYLPSPPDTLDKKNGGSSFGYSSGTMGGSHAVGGNEKGKKDAGIIPTNFATDFGKSDFHDDALNNVLPWLSPNAYALFSPGGFTTNSTLSAVGVENNQSISVENGRKPPLPFDDLEGQAGIMICVSPLIRKNTSAYGKGPKQPDTPINFHEVFASPKSDARSRFQTADLHHEIPAISDSSNRDSKFGLERHLTELDIKEDEDMNVLLKLAETTPRSNADGDEDDQGTRVFRGAGGAFAFPAGQPVGPPSFLHLPLIGRNSKVTSSSLPKQKDKTGSGKNINPSTMKRKNPGNAESQSNKAIPLSLGNRSAPAYYPTSFLHPSSVPGAAGSFPYQYPQNGDVHSTSYIYSPNSVPAGAATVKGLKKKSNDKISSKSSSIKSNSSSLKRPLTTATNSTNKKTKKESKGGRGPSKKKITQSMPEPIDKEKAAETISAINSASGKKNDKAASLASAILRGVTMRPSGKWQAQLYFAGKSRYIGVFDSREKAALAYEIAREHLQDKNATSSKDTELHVNAARKAAFEGVNEKDPRLGH